MMDLWDRRVNWIIRTEVMRSWRRLTDDPGRLLAFVLVPITVAVGAGIAVVVPDPLLASLGDPDVETLARATTAGIWILGTLSIVSRTASITGPIDGKALLLSSVTTKTIVRGTLLADFVRGTILWSPLVVVAIGAAVSVVGVAGALGLLLAYGLGFASTLAVGYFGGFLVLRLATVLSARQQWTVLGAGATGLAALVVGIAAAPIDPLETLGALPPAWYLDLVLALGGGSGDGRLAVAIAAASIVSVSLFDAGSRRIADAVWTTDGDTGDDRQREPAPEHSSGRPQFRSSPTRAIVWRAMIRPLRDPKMIKQTTFPLFALGALFIVPEVRTDPGPYLLQYTPGIAVWIAIIAFALHPLGHDGRGAPALLTSGIASRSYVTAYATVTGIVAITLTTVVALSVGVLTSVSMTTAGIVWFLSVLLTVPATTLSITIGLRLPGTPPERTSDQIKPSVTSRVIVLVSLALLFVPGALALTIISGVIPLPGPLQLPLGGLIGSQIVLSIVITVLSYIDATDQFETYRMA